MQLIRAILFAFILSLTFVEPMNAAGGGEETVKPIDAIYPYHIGYQHGFLFVFDNGDGTPGIIFLTRDYEGWKYIHYAEDGEQSVAIWQDNKLQQIRITREDWRASSGLPPRPIP